MISHAPRTEGDSATLCAALLFAITSQGTIRVGELATPGGGINCPQCRSIINHIRANITEHGYRYVILERK